VNSEKLAGLTDYSARELSRLLVTREASTLEVVDAHLDRIARINPLLNAIVTLDAQGAREHAREIDRRRAAGQQLGPFAGLPIAIKDMEPTGGMRTTFGSPIFRDHVPEHDSLMVERLCGHGMNIIGKTNTREFAMGSQTFNQVFGATRNPWDTERTCGGSSGGAAPVSGATRMLPFADGSDLGGSLRNPGNFNSVFGPCGPARGECPSDRRAIRGRRCRCSGRLRARRAARPSCWRQWPAQMRAIHYRFPRTRRSFLRPLRAISRACAWPGARRWAACR
jgi:amidase